MPDSSVPDATVLFRTMHGIGRITLNRPAALNALDQSMIEQITTHLEHCRNDDRIVAVVLDSSNERAFCAGGDVRALLRPNSNSNSNSNSGSSQSQSQSQSQSPGAGPGSGSGAEPDGDGGGSDLRARIERFFVDEYRLDYAIHRFPKPIVAIMDAVTMGGGMGLSQGASLRITTDRSRIAMPETKIGLTPDVGATHFLNRMPIEMALYIGLTGTTLSGPDAVACGLADVCVSHATLTNVDERPGAADLSAIDDRDGAQSSARSSTLTRALRHAFAPVELPSDEAPIARQRAWIVRHFHPDALPVDIVASLSHALENLHDSDETRGEREWLDATRTALTSYSPTMIHVTREALLRARAISLADSFRLEMGIVIRSIEEGDFREGVRAHLIDKDRTPAWQPDTLAAVAHARVEHFLSSPWPADRHPLAELGQDAPRE